MPCRFITVQCRPVLRQGCLNPKEIEAFTKYSLENNERKTPIFVVRCFLNTHWPQLKDPWTYLIKVVFSSGPLVLCIVVPSIESYRLNATIIDCRYLLRIYKWMDKFLEVCYILFHFFEQCTKITKSCCSCWSMCSQIWWWVNIGHGVTLAEQQKKYSPQEPRTNWGINWSLASNWQKKMT